MTAGPVKYVVGRLADFPDGGRMLVDVNGREVGIFRVKGKLYGILNRCPHLGGPLCYGQIVGSVRASEPGKVEIDSSVDLLTCPYHNWEFNIETGQSYWNPERLRARPYQVVVEHGGELIDDLESGVAGRVPGPYRAEMVEVLVEDDYIVVSLSAGARATRHRSPGAVTAQPAQEGTAP